MVLPEGDHACQQIRAPEQRRPQRLGTAECQVVAAARTAVPPVEPKGLGAKPLLTGDSEQRLDQLRELGPAGGWMDVHLDHSGIRSDQQRLDPRVRWRPVALQDYGSAGLCRT